MRQLGAVRLVENEPLEAFHPFSKPHQRGGFEMVQKEVRDEHAAGCWGRHFKQVALMPIHASCSGWSRCQIVSRNRRVREILCQTMAQRSITRADFHHAAPRGSWESAHFAANPALVSHQEIDAAQVASTAHGLGIVCRQVVENFWDHDTVAHGG